MPLASTVGLVPYVTFAPVVVGCIIGGLTGLTVRVYKSAKQSLIVWAKSQPDNIPDIVHWYRT
jgi:hypothetical protein